MQYFGLLDLHSAPLPLSNSAQNRAKSLYAEEFNLLQEAIQGICIIVVHLQPQKQLKRGLMIARSHRP